MNDADMDRPDPTQALLEALRADHRPVARGGLRRAFGTARAAARTGVGVLTGRLRGGDDDGLAAADLQTIERLVTSLGRLKGLPMKMGQILGYIDETMPPEMRELLSLLQTQSQPTEMDAVHRVIRDDLGELAEALLADLEPEPVSVASIGQVHRGRLPNGTVVAVKVLHPGIEEAIAADFGLARIGPVFVRLMAPGAAGSVKSFIAEAQARLREECDYALEAERQKTFAAIYADHETLSIPPVHDDWSSRHVLTTTWCAGRSFDTFLADDPAQSERDRVGRALFELFFGTLYREGLFHADPHPGNFAFPADGRVIIYDFGCVRGFDRATIAALVALARAVQADDEAAMADGLEALGARRPSKARDVDTARRLLRGFFGPLLSPTPGRITADVTLEAREVLRNKRALLRMRLPGKLLFLFRIRFGLYAVLARLGAVCDWRALESDLFEAAAAKWSDEPTAGG